MRVRWDWPPRCPGRRRRPRCRPAGQSRCRLPGQPSGRAELPVIALRALGGRLQLTVDATVIEQRRGVTRVEPDRVDEAEEDRMGMGLVGRLHTTLEVGE